MERMSSTEERPCPDCGATLESGEEGTFVCPKEDILWVAYGPKLLLRPAMLKNPRLSLELPWEGRRAA
jgi:hypothetical protein